MATQQLRARSNQFTRTVKAQSSTSIEPAETEVDQGTTEETKSLIGGQPNWIILAIASGACAAINGVFAKLTTTSLTASLASSVSNILGLGPDNHTINLGLRGTFFALNLVFNGVMWTLFTAALTKSTSTTRVSIVNVSANFFITAILGWAIFSEKLPLGWWTGAALLAAGNVVIGRKDEGNGKGDGATHAQGKSQGKKGLLGEAEWKASATLNHPL